MYKNMYTQAYVCISSIIFYVDICAHIHTSICTDFHIDKFTNIYIRTCTMNPKRYGVATISKLLKIISLFGRIQSLL